LSVFKEWAKEIKGVRGAKKEVKKRPQSTPPPENIQTHPRGVKGQKTHERENKRHKNNKTTLQDKADMVKCE
jgi:hypothetical protein